MQNDTHHEPWDKGKLVGQKPPLKLKEIWVIRIRLQLGKKAHDLAMFVHLASHYVYYDLHQHHESKVIENFHVMT